MNNITTMSQPNGGREMTIEQAINLLKSEYEKAKDLAFVKKSCCLCAVQSLEDSRFREGE